MKQQPFAVSRSTLKDPRKALDEVLSHVEPPILFALIYVGAHYDVDWLTQEINRRLKGTPWIGCTTSGEITSAGLQEEGMALMACSDLSMQVKAAHASGVKNNPEDAATFLASQLQGDRFDHLPHRTDAR
ncbi:MAG: FIST N-terminal domain-containing protein [Myxococcales bacterium]